MDEVHSSRSDFPVLMAMKMKDRVSRKIWEKRGKVKKLGQVRVGTNTFTRMA